MNHHKLHCTIVSAIAFLALFSGFVTLQPVNAQSSPQYGVRPSRSDTPNTSTGYFTLKGQPGSSIRETVTLSNPGTIPVRLQLNTVDAVTGERSGANYLTIDKPRQDVGAWIVLDSSVVELAPKKQIDVGFSVIIPKETRTGEHLGGLTVQLIDDSIQTQSTAKSNGNAGTFDVKAVSRSVVAILVNVEGQPLNKELRINETRIGPRNNLPTLFLNLQNSGNTLVKAQGQLTLTDNSGKQVLVSNLSLDTIIPQNTIEYPVPVRMPATPGSYKVYVSLDYGGIAPTKYEGTVVLNEAIPQETQATISGALIPSGKTSPASTDIPKPVQAGNKVETNENNAGLLLPVIIGGTLVLIVAGAGGFMLGSRKKTSR